MNLITEQRAAEIFVAAMDCEPADRADFCRRECGDDNALRECVDALVRADATFHNPLDAIAPPMQSEMGNPYRSGAIIGRYTLTRLLGFGGMASVYEAVQDSPRRTVAVKIMNRGTASRDTLRRFHRESQILGRLRHPGIAQIHEAAVHDDGQGGVPYFAMEFIPEARTITEWADHARLKLEQRVDLMVQVCDAVAHGHDYGIIHRDLKPSNLLVDAAGMPKVIDFGIARVNAMEIASATLHTETGSLIGTLPYMSPEQAQSGVQRLDARSDVYSLGVVLYELLCGRRPYDVDRAGILDAAAIIREKAPVRPTAVSGAIPGDIETIVLKALEKDPSRRYAGAAALAEDLRRFRAQRPIAARPPSMAYRVRTMARRNKALVSGLATAFAVLLGALTVVSVMAIRLQREAVQREEVIGFLDSLLIAGDAYPFSPSRLHAPQFGANAKWIEVIDRAVLTLNDAPLTDPLADAAIRHRLGMIYFWMCRFDEAGDNLSRAYAIRRLALGEVAPATIDTRIGLALNRVFLSDNIAAERAIHQVVQDCRETLGDDRRTLDALHAWYITLLYLDYNDPLDDIANEMCDIASRHPELGYPKSVYQAFLGHARMLAGAFDESEWLLREAIEHSETDSPGSLTHAWAWFMLGRLYAARDDYATAEEYLRIGRDMWHSRSGPNMAEFEIPVDILMIRQPHKREEGLHLLRRSVDGVRDLVGDEHPFFSSIAYRASEGYMIAEQWPEAESLLRESMKYWSTPPHVWLQRDAMVMSRLAVALHKQGKLDEAESALRQAVEIADKFTPEQWSRHSLGSADHFRGRLTALLDERVTSPRSSD